MRKVENLPDNFADLINQLDAGYKPFPDISEWDRVTVNETQWEDARTEIIRLKEANSEEIWEEAKLITLRMAAVDTGAIEGLYKVDRGFTISVATQAASLDITHNEHYQDIKQYYAAQLKGYELTLDAITKTTPISDVWVRSLHATICAPQKTYLVYTPVGWQEHELPKGDYKTNPNHVMGHDGKGKFSYSPVIDVVPEMQRFLNIIRSPKFEKDTHPVIQSTYVHYAIARIHPFADGNGRVARAIASLYLTRAALIPLVIFADQRDEYIDALENADSGNYQPLVNFIFARFLGTVEVVKVSINSAKFKDAQIMLEDISELYVAYGGLEHNELDKRAIKFIKIIEGEFQSQISKLILPGGGDAIAKIEGANYAGTNSHRSLVNQSGRNLLVRFSTPVPASARVEKNYRVYISRKETAEGEFLLEERDSEAHLTAKISDIENALSAEFEIKLKLWIQGEIRNIVQSLNSSARSAFLASGYN